MAKMTQKEIDEYNAKQKPAQTILKPEYAGQGEIIARPYREGDWTTTTVNLSDDNGGTSAVTVPPASQKPNAVVDGGNPTLNYTSEISDDNTMHKVPPKISHQQSNGSVEDSKNVSSGFTRGTVTSKRNQADFYDFQHDPQYRTAMIGDGAWTATRSFLSALTGKDIGDNYLRKYMEDTRGKYAEMNQTFGKDSVDLGITAPQANTHEQESHSKTWGKSISKDPNSEEYSTSKHLQSWAMRLGISDRDISYDAKRDKYFFKAPITFARVQGPNGARFGDDFVKQAWDKYFAGDKNAPSFSEIAGNGSKSGEFSGKTLRFVRDHKGIFSTNATQVTGAKVAP